MVIILLQAGIALGAIMMMVIGVAFLSIPVITIIWSEIAIRRLNAQHHKLTFKEQAKVIGQKLLYTIGIVLLLIGLLFLSLHFMDFSPT